MKCTGCKVHGKGPGKKWCSLYTKGKIRSKLCKITNKAGNIVDIVKQASLLKDDSGKVIGSVETLTDISEIAKKDHEISSLRRILRSEEGFHGILGKSVMSESPPWSRESSAASDETHEVGEREFQKAISTFE